MIQYIDYPPAEAVYEILRSSLVELMARGIVEQVDVPNAESASIAHRMANVKSEHEQSAVATLHGMSLEASVDQYALSHFVGANLYSIAVRCKVGLYDIPSFISLKNCPP